MSNVIAIHSFRRGSGRSTLTANLGALLASDGFRVGIMDTDFQAPSQHLYLGLSEGEIVHTLNSYLRDEVAITQAAYDLSSRNNTISNGKLVLVPASGSPSDIVHILQVPYNFEKLNEGLEDLEDAFGLDYILLDVTAGLNEDTLTTIVLASTLIIVMRPDRQDYQGTAVSIEIAQSLGVPRLLLVLNDMPDNLESNQVRTELEQTYQCEVAALLLHSDTMLALGSSKTMILHDPQDPFVKQLGSLATCLANE